MNPVIFLTAGGEHNDRGCLILADFTDSRKPVEFRHHDVHDNQIIAVGAAHFDRLHAVFSLFDFISFEQGIFANQVAYALFIIHDQELHFAIPPNSPSTCFCI